MTSNSTKIILTPHNSVDYFNSQEPCVEFGDIRVHVIGNQRYYNAFRSKKLDIDVFKNQDCKNLEYGFVAIQEGDTIDIYNDIFGAYPLFISTKNNEVALSNFFDFSAEDELDTIAVIQFIHFNHILKERTLSKHTRRIKGGSIISINKQELSCNILNNWQSLEKELFGSPMALPEVKSWSTFKNFISDSKKADNPNVLTLTGGFDSRLLFGVLLDSGEHFDTLTWGQEGNLQTTTAEKISQQYKISHREIKLDASFQSKMNQYLEEIITAGSESPFAIDIPQFIHMCKALDKGTNLISGFMGSEIIRGPSYSSQVTLTKFAADIGLAESRSRIKELIYDFQKNHPFIEDTQIEDSIETLVDDYATYSRVERDKTEKNHSIFKYLFLEKYPKIYGPIIKLHLDHDINLINPFMNIDFIKLMLHENSAASKLKPYQGNAFYNFKLYKYYAYALSDIYPDLNNTLVDRGYKIKDLTSTAGLIRLPLFQIYRKYLRQKTNKGTPTVDSKKWYHSHLKTLSENLNPKLIPILNMDGNLKSEHPSSFDAIKCQLIMGLNKKIKS